MSAEDSCPDVVTPEVSTPDAGTPTTSKFGISLGDHIWRYSLRDLLDETLWGCAFLAIWLFLFFWGGGHEDLVCLYGSYVSGGFALIFWLRAFLRKMSSKPDKKSALGLFIWAILLTLVGAGLYAATMMTTGSSKTPVYYGNLLVISGYGTIVLFYWCWLIYQVFVRKLFVEYRLTPKQFIHKRGFLVRREDRYEIWDIEQVNMTANLWQRIIGVGEVELLIKDQKYDKKSADIVTGGGKDSVRTLILHGLRKPEEVQRLINQYRMFVRTEVLNSVVKA